MSSPFFQVIFRTCDVVNSVHHAPRPFNLDKRSLIKICFLSLLDALQGQRYQIFVLGDKLSDDMINFFRQFPVELTNGYYGNDESIRQSINKAIEYPDNHWVYFCEDDYIHRPETFRYVADFIEHKEQIIPPGKRKRFDKTNHLLNKADIFFFLADYPDRYLAEDRERFYLFRSSDCHWRQVANVTFTFLVKATVIKKYRKIFEQSAAGANDGYLSDTLFREKKYSRENLCLSPVPGLTSHMHVNTLTPLIDWGSLMEKYRAGI